MSRCHRNGDASPRHLKTRWLRGPKSLVSTVTIGLLMTLLGIGLAVAASIALAPQAALAGAASPHAPQGDCIGGSVVSSPDAGSSDNTLLGVAAVSPNDVWAVGNYISSGGVHQTLTMHWNGTQWSIATSPNPGSSINRLFAVAAVSANDVWAVGNYSIPASDTFRTLTMHWNGTQWSLISSPNPGLDYNLVIGVTATSADDAWAVGFYTNGRSSPPQTLTIHWDGTQWSFVSSPNSNLNNNYLYGVAATSSDDVWAVGYSYNTLGTNPSQALALHWNGTQWNLVSNPNPGSTTNTLKAVAVISPNSALAVGIYQSGNANPLQTLVLAYANQCSTPTATPTAVLPTRTPTGSSTPAVTVTTTTTPCAMNFSDVLPTDYFYESVRYLYCADVISGYGDGTFRPFNNTTRGQLTKIVVLALGWTLEGCPSTGHFSDVLPGDPFFCFVETAYSHNVISGYGDGTFRPGNNVTRGQLSKVVVLAMNWTDPCPSTGHFSDVPPGDPFFCFVETAYGHSIISGYSDGTFRPGNNATRGQIAKIVYEAITNP